MRVPDIILELQRIPLLDLYMWPGQLHLHNMYIRKLTSPYIPTSESTLQRSKLESNSS